MPSLLPSGSSRPSGSVTTNSFWIGLTLAGAAIALAVVGFSLESGGSGELPGSAALSPNPLATESLPVVSEGLHIDQVATINPLHQLEVSQHEGRRVYRIRATAYGDEIIVDYITGKLISVKETPGKFVLPPRPMPDSIVTAS